MSMPEQSRELALPDELLNPVTGELVPTADAARVAAALEEIRRRRDDLNIAISVFTEPLLEYSRNVAAARTFELGDVRVKVSSDHEIEWDFEVLLELRDLGLPEERYNQLVQATVTYKVNGTVARQVAAARPEYAAVIERAKIRIPKRQYVTLGP